jgi:hypothetical protein
MTTILQLYAAIKGRLKTVDLNAYDHVPGSAEWPGAFVLPPMAEHEGAADDWLTLRFDVVIMVSSTIDKNQLKLLEYQALDGPKSIKGAFDQDPSLGFPDVHARVLRSRPLGYEEQAGYLGFGAVFEVVVRLG